MKRVLCLLTGIVILLTFASCGDVSKETKIYAAKLYENRVADVTDIDRDKVLVDAVLSADSYGAYSIDLVSYQSEHTIKITFETLMSQSDKFTEHMYRIGTVLLALAENAHAVQFCYQYNNENSAITGTKCDVSQNRAKKLLGNDAFAFVKSEDDVVKMLQILELDK